MRARRAFTSDGQARATNTADRATHSAGLLSPSACRDERATGRPSAARVRGRDERATGPSAGRGAAAGEVPPLSSRSR